MLGTRKYLITGGSGFLGSALVRRLVRLGATVRVLDNNTRGALSRLEEVLDEIEFVQADIRDASAVRDAARGCTSVCHLAFINGTENFYARPDEVLDVGIRGMLNVLDACAAHGVGELFLASSSEVYQTPPVVPTDEAVPLVIPDPFNPRYSYAAGKIVSELLAIYLGRSRFERVVVFRPHNVYGPDMGAEHVVPEFALRMDRLSRDIPSGSVPFPIQGSGAETRAFIHIDDFTDGLVMLLKHGRHLGIYNVGTEEERSVADVAYAVGRVFGRQIAIQPGELRAGGTVRRCPNTAKLRGLGFRPVVPFEDGIRRTVEWYVENAAKFAPKKRWQGGSTG